MGSVVVADQVHLASGIAARQRIEELEELLVAMTPIATSVHLARGHLQRGEQAGGAVALIIVSHLRRDAGSQRQQRCGAIKRLDLRFFVHAQHQRAFGWVEIKTHDVGHLLIERRVGAELEVLDPMRLQAVLLPNAVYGGGAEPDLLSQSAGAPVGSSLRWPHRRTYHRAFPGMADAPASPATRSAPKPGDSEFAEAPPPHADRRLANVQALGQLANTLAM